MKIFTETAIASIKANEEAELRVISFALGLLSSRVHLGTDFVDYGAWGIGFKCHQYITTCNLRKENTFYTSAQYLEAAAKAMEAEIARHEDFADLTSCILSEGDGVRTVQEWAERCRVKSIIRSLIAALLKPEQEDDDDYDLSDIRHDIVTATPALKVIACALISAWEETETKKGWGK